MGRDSGRFWRNIRRLFRERQIYHRADGVVRYIKLTPQTQFALATIMLGLLLWIAYASVNVVFKETIIVGKDRQHRISEDAYRRRLAESETAVEEISSLNVLYTQEFDAGLAQLQNRHEAIRAIVENKITGDIALEQLSTSLARAGGPEGIKLKNGNRVMVDPTGREPTPRQSRISKLEEDALGEVFSNRLSFNIDDPVLNEMRSSAARYGAQQILLLATIEEDIRSQTEELEAILASTGIDMSPMVTHERVELAALNQQNQPDEYSGTGGPLYPIDDEDGLAQPSVYYQSVRRVEKQLNELNVLEHVLTTIPLASPINVHYRQSSRFGARWDPIKKRTRAMHYGLDFGAPRRSPVLAPAAGRVSFAGRRHGFGNTVEIDHGNGLMTRFAHLNSISVKSGQKVSLQQEVGKLGNTGRSTGPHLHYEVHYRGKPVNPEPFIKAGRYVFEG